MNFTGGLIKDVSLVEMPDSSWRNARNIVQDKDNNILNENGFNLVKVLDDGFEVIGLITTGEDCIIFSVNGYIGEIGILHNSTYTRIIRDKGYIYLGKVFDSFKFNKSYPIHGTYYFNYKGELIIIWTDNYNAVRLLNTTTLNGIPITVDKIYNPPLYTIGAVTGTFSIQEIIELNLFHTFSYGEYATNIRTPNFYLNPTLSTNKPEIISDVDRDTITVIAFVRKLDNTNTYSKWFGGLDVINLSTDGNVYINWAKDIISENCKAYQIGVVIYKDGIATFNIAYESYSNGTATFNINNPIVAGLDISELLIPYNTFDTCKTLTQLNNRLICANIDTIDIGYQKYANNIEVKAKLYKDGLGNKLLFSDVGRNQYVFCPDEVYAFYVTFVLKDGRETMSYHIPGRVAEGIETNYDSTINGKVAKRFHVLDTSSALGGDLYKMGYWENETETYPTYGDDVEVWEYDISNPIDGRQKVSGEVTLAGKKVRHHKIPSLYTTGGHCVSVEFGNIWIPERIVDLVSGAYISYASRDKQKTLLGYCLITNDTFINTGNTGYDLFCQPIDLMIEQAKVSIDYFKTAYYYNNVTFDLAGGDYILNLENETPTFSATTHRTITNHIYIPRDNDMLGNYGSNAKLALDSNASYVPDYGVTTNYFMCTLHDLKKDMYVPYNNQKLIPCGSYTIAERKGNVINVVNGKTIFCFAFKGDMFITSTGQFEETYYTDYAASKNAKVAYETFKYATVSKFDDVTYENDLYAYETYLLAEFAIILPAIIGGTPTAAQIDTYISNAKFFYDKILYYNSYPALNIIKSPTPYTFNSEFSSEFKNRIVRSIVNNKEGKEINWRKFLANEYFELDRKKGDIQVVEGYNESLIIHTIYSTFLAKNKDVLLTNNVEAYLGKADIFETEPTQFIDTPSGYAGCSNQFGRVITKYGYVYCDKLNGKIFLIKDSIVEISNTGISKLLKNLIISTEYDNPYLYDGIVFGYDKEYERLLCSINVGNGQVFYTLSYSLINNYWLAFHSYTPCIYFDTSFGLHTIINSNDRGGIYKHNGTNKGVYYHTNLDTLLPTRVANECYIEPVIVYDKTVNKLLNSVIWQSSIVTPVSKEYLEYKTITSIAIYSLLHYTGIIVLEDVINEESELTTDRYKRILYNTKKDGLYRNVEGQWNFNEIRDALVHNVTINKAIQPETRFIDEFGNLNTTQINVLGTFVREYFNKHLFIDRVFAIRMIYDNIEQNTLILHNIDANVLQSYR